MSSDRTKVAESIISQEVNNVSMGSNEVKQNGCAACHVLFTLVDKMQVSETEAADLLAETLLINPQLDDQFIEMVENIHMKQRLMGGGFSIKTREAKDRFIDSNLKTVLAELCRSGKLWSGYRTSEITHVVCILGNSTNNRCRLSCRK